MSLSPVANRSFLHGDRKPSPSSEKIVYATLDSLALKRATLPLQLLPVDESKRKRETCNEATARRSSFKVDTPSKERSEYLLVASKSEDRKCTASPSVIERKSEEPFYLQCAIDNPIRSSDPVSEDIDIREPQESDDSSNEALQSDDYERIELTSSENVAKQVNLNNNEITLKKSNLSEKSEERGFKKRTHFAKNVLHFVPEYLVKGSRKKKNVLSASLSSLKTSTLDVNSMARFRSRSLSREETRCLNISSPTNFVHVASATSPNLINENSDVHLEQVITHEQKCATLPLLVRNEKETRSDESLKRELMSELRVRTKMLEQSQRVKTSENQEANASFLWRNTIEMTGITESVDEDQYDDVGPKNSDTQEDDYDDVGFPSSDPPEVPKDDSIYDDVMSPITERISEPREMEENQESYRSLNNDYSSVDSDELDQDVYDDVGFPAEERVNSLYAGSTTGSILGWNGKESEWEDLEDPVALPDSWKDVSKRKGQRSRKVRRRSRCRRSSSKSSNKSTRNVESQVAVSLGSGSVLVVGRTEKVEEWNREESDRTAQNSQRTQGLVQLRVIDLDEDVDTQETSCYVHEDNAEDSPYESLRSFPQDEFSSDSGTETEKNDPNRLVIEYLEAPTRPNPPPPREISLTRTLGRRIKMLRRTWSITKGSLGRMRRRTSVDEEHEEKECDSNLDGGRYFGFARHFKKSVAGFSTFYLNGHTDSIKTDRSSEPIGEPDHYSVLAEQEPLYQFYAAAAARGAFDSNSDDYEEVEDMIPSRSTTDLAKPGHRTLWCQTPQVINSDLLERLTAEERKIQEAKFEILTSEASYLNSLRVLKNEFFNEPSFNEILTPLEKEKLFGGIPSVLQASEQCLAELETVWRQDPMLHGLPDVLLKYAEKCLDIYVAYCSNQVSIDGTLKDLRTRKGIRFLDVVSQIEARTACQSLSLHSFLMLPMQRITRLPLLADAVLSKLPIEHVDRPQWERVLSGLSYVVAECNEGARVAAKEAEMESLARKLEYSAKIKPIVLKGKHLVKTGPVVQLLSKADAEYKLTFGRKFNKTHLYLLLLTDYLLVAKYKSNTQDATYTVIDTCKRSLIALEAVNEDSPFAGRNAMLLTLLENYSGHQVEYILTCESDTERQRWLEAVSPSKRGLMEETLYESWDCPQVVALYCYSPNQPDELSLHPGDVINVFRKMSDGWYHGEKLLDGEQGWFPGNYTKEVASEHVRARNLKQRHRLLALNGNALQRKTKQQSSVR
ncbi:ephexin isoform X2 [Megachile rotundata]|uniref:ephexin isoform X2 n=1 Tax=Megachile rotundata TaxID=143995 RepID=UPI003FCF500D